VLRFDGQVEEKLQMLRQAIKRQTDILVQVKSWPTGVSCMQAKLVKNTSGV